MTATDTATWWSEDDAGPEPPPVDPGPTFPMFEPGQDGVADDAPAEEPDADTAPPPIPAEQALAVVPDDGHMVIRPAAELSEIVKAVHAFQQVKAAMLVESDYQVISGKRFIKRAGWLKVAMAMALSTEIRHDVREWLPDGTFTWHFTVRASARNGRFADAAGSCHSKERAFSHTEHDTRATAQTRATNRAISNLVGGGELSAEEMDKGADPPPARASSARRPPTLEQRQAQAAADLKARIKQALGWVEVEAVFALQPSCGHHAAPACGDLLTWLRVHKYSPNQCFEYLAKEHAARSAEPAQDMPICERDAEGVPLCADCGHHVKELSFRDGTHWSVEQLCSLGLRKHNRWLCINCYRTANEARRKEGAA